MEHRPFLMQRIVAHEGFSPGVVHRVLSAEATVAHRSPSCTRRATRYGTHPQRTPSHYSCTLSSPADCVSTNRTHTALPAFHCHQLAMGTVTPLLATRRECYEPASIYFTLAVGHDRCSGTTVSSRYRTPSICAEHPPFSPLIRPVLFVQSIVYYNISVL